MIKKTLIQIGTTPASDSYSIKVIKGGPYLVKGRPLLMQKIIEQNEQGQSWNYKNGKTFEINDDAHLCRCGLSSKAPFCDGSHKFAKFDLEETASFAPLLEGSEVIEGPTLTLADNQNYCAFGRFCDVGDRIWKQVTEPGEASEKLTIKMAHLCPAGRLLVFDNKSGEPVESPTAPSLALIEDPGIGVSGPIMVSGGIRVESANGESYEVRNRQALCRCGSSKNKPFCDGNHASMKFQDGLKTDIQ